MDAMTLKMPLVISTPKAKQKAMKMLMYPMAIIGLSVMTLGVLITVALPPLLKSFERLGAETPFVTRLAMGMVSGFLDNILIIFVAALLFIIGYTALRRVPRARRIMDAMTLKMPLVGSLVLAGELSRFSRNTAMLLESGVSASRSFQMGTSGCKNMIVRECFSAAEESLMSGHSMAEALKRTSVLPTLFVELITIGEDSNTLSYSYSRWSWPESCPVFREIPPCFWSPGFPPPGPSRWGPAAVRI